VTAPSFQFKRLALEAEIQMAPSPLQLKAQALETGTTMWHDGLTVTPEGVFVICGRRCTLNEAIMYLGNRAVTRAKAAA
jgi:hypothetical protein